MSDVAELVPEGLSAELWAQMPTWARELALSRPPRVREAFARDEVAYEQQRRQLEFDNRMRHVRELSEIGARFATRTLAQFRVTDDNRDAYLAAQRAIFKFDPRLGLTGGAGTGKSHLAAAIVNANIARGEAAVFVTAQALLTKFRALISKRKRDKEDSDDLLLSRYASVPTLVIDDLGKEQLTAWSASLLFELVNRRYEHNQPLIVTSNAGVEGLVRHYASLPEEIDPALGPALIDRILEMTGFPWVTIRGESQRWGA